MKIKLHILLTLIGINHNQLQASLVESLEIPAHIKTICVHCASSKVAEAYHEQARELGALLGRAGIALVYGGANCGLMGDLANSFLQNGGQRLVGVVTTDLDQRYASAMHVNLTEKIVTKDLGIRKSVMANLSDAFIALPGGIGTLDEFTAVPAEKQLGEHQKPVILVSYKGHYDPLLIFYNNCVKEGFTQPQHLKLFTVVSTVQEIIPAFNNIEDGFIAPEREWWNNAHSITH